jgi:hypothetical protein
MSFDPDKFLNEVSTTRAPAQGFNPDQFLIEVLGPADPGELATGPKQERNLKDGGSAFLESAGNELAMGYLPQIQAGIEKIMPNPTRQVDEQLRAQGFEVPQEASYVQMRDENIKRQANQAQAHPEAAMGGMVAGALTTAPIIGAAGKLAGLGRAATAKQRYGTAAAMGGGLSALRNPGDTEGEISPIQAGERGSNAALGAAMGAGAQALVGGVSKAVDAVKRAPERLEALSKNAAFKAAGAMLKDFRKAFGRNSTEEIGETLLKRNIVQAGDKFDDIAAKALTEKGKVGQEIGNIYKQVEENIAQASAKGQLTKGQLWALNKTELDGNVIAKAAEGKLIRAGKNDIANSEIGGRVKASIENLKTRGKDLSIKDLLEIKSNLDGDIDWAKRGQEVPAVQAQLRIIRDSVNKAIQNRVRAADKVMGGGELMTQLKDANKAYGHLSTANRFANDRVSRESANRYFSLGDRITGGVGGAIGAGTADNPVDRVKNGLIGMLAGAAAGRAGRYSMPVVAKSAQRMSIALKAPATFAKYGQPIIEAAKNSPAELTALLNQLQNDPEFREAVKLPPINQGIYRAPAN